MLKLGVPSKGRLMEKTFSWFGNYGITLSRAGNDREYRGAVEGVEGVELVLLSASEIPRELAAGRLHLGVTGSDLVHEKIPNWDQKIGVIAELGFGGADLVIAVPEAWVDVNDINDLDEVAYQFRVCHGHRLRIATKYHRMVRSFLREAGIVDFQLIDSQGATEGTIRNETAEAIADITSTGSTLRANNLKILENSLIHSSQATLFRSRTLEWCAEERDTWAELRSIIGG